MGRGYHEYEAVHECTVTTIEGPSARQANEKINVEQPVSTYRRKTYVNVDHWEIGAALLPERRARGLGWRAQALLCDYLFGHTAAQRIEASTHSENIAEQRALEKAGFRLEGILRAVEFRDGGWRDGHLYSRLRSDPAPAAHSRHSQVGHRTRTVNLDATGNPRS